MSGLQIDFKSMTIPGWLVGEKQLFEILKPSLLVCKMEDGALVEEESVIICAEHHVNIFAIPSPTNQKGLLKMKICFFDITLL